MIPKIGDKALLSSKWKLLEADLRKMQKGRMDQYQMVW